MKRTTGMWLVAMLAVGGVHADSLPSFSAVDTDGNGELTLEEARAAGVADPESLDANGDRRIDMLEYRSARQASGSTGNGESNPAMQRSLTDYPPATQ